MSGRAQYIVGAGRTPAGGREAAHLNVLDLVHLIYLSLIPILLRNVKSINLLVLHIPSPPQTQHQGSCKCTEVRSFISCSALSMPRPSPVQAACQVRLHTCLVLPLLTVFPRIVSFWDAPYLFLISSVPQIELFSSSSKEVSYTFD